MGYEDTRQKILSTLMQRPNNTEIQPGAHQDFALSLLEYIRSVELISGSTLIGVAEEDTMPVQSNIGNESYIAGVPSQSVIVYKNFINKYGEPISVITENESKFVILFWNKQYWEKQEISISVPQSSSDTSSALRALFVAAGAEYNDTGVDIVKTTPWAEYVDEVDFKAVNNIDVLNYTTVNLHSIVQDGTKYQYVIDNGVFKVVGRASSGELVHDERYCVHRAGHYYLNGLGDITEKQMMLIYNRTAIPFNKYISYFRMQNEIDLPYIPRTNILSDAFFAGMTFENLNYAFYASPIEVFKASGNNDRNFAAIPEFDVDTLRSTFEGSQMKYLIGALNIKKQSTTNTQYIGRNATNLRVLLFKNLCGNLKTFHAASKISKSSILYAIKNSIATTAITITLHPIAYARFKDNPEVVAALESKPLVTLVSEI